MDTVTNPDLASPNLGYDPEKLLREAYEAHVHEMGREATPFEKAIAPYLESVTKVYGHLDEAEYRRFARATVARINADAFYTRAREQYELSGNAIRALYAELFEKYELGTFGVNATSVTPLIDTTTGAVFLPKKRDAVTEPAPAESN